MPIEETRFGWLPRCDECPWEGVEREVDPAGTGEEFTAAQIDLWRHKDEEHLKVRNR